MFKFANRLSLPGLVHTNNNNRQNNVHSSLLLLLGSMNQIEHFTIQCNKYNTIINKSSANSEQLKTIIINGSDNCENALLQFSFSSTPIQSLSRDGFEEYPIYNKKKNIHYYSNSASYLLLKGFTNINRRFYHHQYYHQNNNKDNTEIAHKIEELWNQTHASFSNYIEMSKVKHDANTNEQRLLVSDYLKRQGLWANSEVIWTLLATFDELN